ncbi:MULTISPECIES: hypothetical protein [Paenibacillus]|uniref:hypothetical protein n=1 Tax=Paenibacillus TaxID=44249 RepID=UPI00096BE64E|nr:hypothetical protein [Paenibacillus odorifer]OME27171.1 hypothetical protein BSK57_05515 [Paenibacillus odorifer]
MTLAAVLATKDFTVAVADRRRTQLGTGIRVDDVRKIHQVNEHVITAYSGIYVPTGDGGLQGLAEEIITSTNVLITERSTVEDVTDLYSKTLLGCLNAGVPKDSLELTFHFGGKGKDGRYMLGRVSCWENFEPMIMESNDYGLIWSLSRAEYEAGTWLVAQIASLSEITMETVKDLAVSLVEHTAQQDGYVSETYDLIVI